MSSTEQGLKGASGAVPSERPGPGAPDKKDTVLRAMIAFLIPLILSLSLIHI